MKSKGTDPIASLYVVGTGAAKYLGVREIMTLELLEKVNRVGVEEWFRRHAKS